MIIGVVSDVHSSVDRLEAALDAMAGSADEIWCAGDIVLEYRLCRRTVEMIRDRVDEVVQGNHDAGYLRHAPPCDHAGDIEACAYLADLPLMVDRRLQGSRIRMLHASPWPPYGSYLGPHDPAWAHSDELGVDIFITGHTHVPFATRHGSTLIVNPGSVTEPRQPNRRPSYALVDTRHMTAEIRYI